MLKNLKGGFWGPGGVEGGRWGCCQADPRERGVALERGPAGEGMQVGRLVWRLTLVFWNWGGGDVGMGGGQNLGHEL